MPCAGPGWTHASRRWWPRSAASSIGLAAVQELRARGPRVRASSGKLTIAWAETFGEFSVPATCRTTWPPPSTRIYLQPSGRSRADRDRGAERGSTAARWTSSGVEFQVGKRHEYKSAAEQLTEHGFSRVQPGKRLQRAGRLDHRSSSTDGDRPAAASSAARAGPGADRPRPVPRPRRRWTPGLVDALGYRDEVYAGGPEARRARTRYLQYLGRYQRGQALAERARKAARHPVRSGTAGVALIYASGPIRRGPQRPQPAGRRLDGLGHDRARRCAAAVSRPTGSARSCCG